jgi:hypothetical protein
MANLHFPWLFIGPPGTGKTRAARKMIADSLSITEAEVYPKDMRMFKVGDDYECRVYCSPYHFEIDIPDMSMQDKQILVEVLTMLFSAGDVFAGLKTNKRKLVILRRAHCLSLAAAVRLRWILETRICPEGGTGMVWLCAREITGALSVVEDIFVRVRVPVPTEERWRKTWAEYPKLADSYAEFEGRMDRAAAIVRWGGKCLEQGSYPRTVAHCYEDLIVAILRGCIRASRKKIVTPPLSMAIWIRERVYDLLGLCQTGTEFLDGYSSAVEKALLNSYCTYPMFREANAVIAATEPNTSYRNPISLEKMLLDITLAFWCTAQLEVDATLDELESHLPVEVHGDTGDLESSKEPVVKDPAPKKSAAKKSGTKGIGKSKKRITVGEGNTIIEPETVEPKKPRRAKKTAVAKEPSVG